MPVTPYRGVTAGFNNFGSTVFYFYLSFVSLVPGSRQQFPVFMFSHFFSAFLDYTAQMITSRI
jgi:hypothetical protein